MMYCRYPRAAVVICPCLSFLQNRVFGTGRLRNHWSEHICKPRIVVSTIAAGNHFKFYVSHRSES